MFSGMELNGGFYNMSYAVGAIQTAIVNLTSSQIKNMWATAPVIVNAPGAGFFIQPLRAYFQLFPGSQMYGNPGVGLVLGYGVSPFIGPVCLGDNMDVGSNAFNTFQEVPYANGMTTCFDVTKNGDTVVHKPSVPLTQVVNPGALTLTSVDNSLDNQGTTVYHGTITGGGGSAYVKYTFTVTGFTNTANNGTFQCTASTATTLTLQNANSVAETHAGTATSQSAQYIGTIFSGASNWIQGPQRGLSFTITGFTNSANNGTFFCVNSSSTSIILNNAAAVNETHAATAQCPWPENQPLIVTISSAFSADLNNVGTLATAKIMSGQAGTGYNIGDTGDIDDGGTGTLAHYTVNTLTGGAGSGIATFTLNSGGGNSAGAFGYVLNFGYLDTNTTAGTGAIFVPQTVTPGNGTGRIICTYTILPI
jgi:hypothetical protein